MEEPRTGQGLRLLPGQAVQRLLAGRGDPRRAGRGLGRAQAPPAPGLHPDRDPGGCEFESHRVHHRLLDS